MTVHEAFLSLGTNLGDRVDQLRSGCEHLRREGVHIVSRSSVYQTDPVDFLEQSDFLNQVVRVETAASAQDLLAICKRIERALGREPGGIRFGPRPLDIDILLYDDCIVDTEMLSIPHPRMMARRFMLVPLVEIDSNLRDPISHRLFSQILAGLDEEKKVTKFLTTSC
ncbi:2-amino-4-hydroxy-6-hydroxymethyldihydropteridine diphosphokinase [Candidatus Bipolaricaulota bacterium]|nr:2-amino-4-hydroxy-6-hydroxymethyldihydropteridine diphosphokinase [Candidatus Bipolaricaulota bacterium]